MTSASPFYQSLYIYLCSVDMRIFYKHPLYIFRSSPYTVRSSKDPFSKFSLFFVSFFAYNWKFYFRNEKILESSFDKKYLEIKCNALCAIYVLGIASFFSKLLNKYIYTLKLNKTHNILDFFWPFFKKQVFCQRIVFSVYKNKIETVQLLFMLQQEYSSFSYVIKHFS